MLTTLPTPNSPIVPAALAALVTGLAFAGLAPVAQVLSAQAMLTTLPTPNSLIAPAVLVTGLASAGLTPVAQAPPTQAMLTGLPTPASLIAPAVLVTGLAFAGLAPVVQLLPVQAVLAVQSMPVDLIALGLLVRAVPGSDRLELRFLGRYLRLALGCSCGSTAGSAAVGAVSMRAGVGRGVRRGQVAGGGGQGAGRQEGRAVAHRRSPCLQDGDDIGEIPFRVALPGRLPGLHGKGVDDLPFERVDRCLGLVPRGDHLVVVRGGHAECRLGRVVRRGRRRGPVPGAGQDAGGVPCHVLGQAEPAPGVVGGVPGGIDGTVGRRGLDPRLVQRGTGLVPARLTPGERTGVTGG